MSRIVYRAELRAARQRLHDITDPFLGGDDARVLAQPSNSSSGYSYSPSMTSVATSSTLFRLDCRTSLMRSRSHFANATKCSASSTLRGHIIHVDQSNGPHSSHRRDGATPHGRNEVAAEFVLLSSSCLAPVVGRKIVLRLHGRHPCESGHVWRHPPEHAGGGRCSRPGAARCHCKVLHMSIGCPRAPRVDDMFQHAVHAQT